MIDSVRYIYDERLTTKIHGADTIVSEIDDAGMTVSVTKNGKRVDFAYDAMGNMVSATPQDGEPVTLEYNSLRLRTKIKDPSGGEIFTKYNGFGNMLQSSQCVHKAGDTIVSKQTYNEVGQIVESQIGNQTIKFAYDEFGRPVSCGNGNHEQTIAYDKVGNIASVTEQIDSLTFTKSLSYDKIGRPVSTTSPTGLNISLNYDPYSNVDAIQCDGKQFWRLVDTDEYGKPTKETYGGIIRTTKYDNRGLPVLDDVAKLMHHEYLFDVNGDMLQKKETYSKQEEVYLFDKHNRLNIWRTFEKDTLRKEIFASYDDVYGNIVSRSDSDFVFNYGEYGLSPHALTSIDAPIRGHDRENSYSYTDFKMLESASNGVDSIFITYGVDFQRRRMKIFKNDSLILTRYYFSDYEEEHYADGRVRKIDYITGPTGLVGVRISTNGTDSLLHAFTDRFGNLVMLVDGDKNIVDRLAYDPWGARRNPADWTKPDTASHILSRGYSMHEHLDCLGLINMNARIYEPATCSFLSPDPLIADESNWLNYNRYLYCLGNPVKFADPTGMQIVTPSDMPLTGPTGVVPQNGGGAFGVVNTYWEYDPTNSCNPVWLVVEGSYNGTNNSNDYFVNYATSENSIYVASVMADHKNAIDWQIANASAKAMEGVNVGGSGWNIFGNINNGMAFVASSAFEYVNKSMNKSLEYFVDGVSTTKDIHFKIPDVEIKGWKCPHFDVYTQKVGAVRAVSTTFKIIGGSLGLVGMGMTLWECVSGNKNWFGEGGLDLIMGVVGYLGPYGIAASAVYFGGKYILEEAGYKFW